MNRFEQVSSNDHQISMGGGEGVPCLGVRVGLYSEVQCTIGNGNMRHPPPMNIQTPVKTLPSHNLVCGL